ncbi:MAG: glycosyltransferase [Bacteroidales bacterium]|nr:glycosyltransferase [Bacteroidales bacterium]
MMQFFDDVNLFFLIVLCAMAFGFIGELLYYLSLYTRAGRIQQEKNVKQKYPPVSVIICARNEAVNLRNNLPFILDQKYRDFEVVVVNDCSEDETEDVLSELKSKYHNLNITTIAKDRKFTHGKKLALTVGIKAARNEWLLLTDADCRPVSENWIATMADNFLEDKEIVLGYGGYIKQKGVLNNIIRYDTVNIAMQYLSYALSGKPYMGVGRNIAYRKSSFFNNKGFASNYHVASGDDDLFVNEVAKKSNTLVEYRTDSHTLSEPSTTFKAWFNQKKRHITTAKYYRSKFKFLLGFELILRFLFYVSFITLCFHNKFYIIAISAFIVRSVIQLIVFKNVMKRLNEKDLLLPSLLYDILMPIVNMVLGISNAISRNRTTWK